MNTMQTAKTKETLRRIQCKTETKENSKDEYNANS